MKWIFLNSILFLFFVSSCQTKKSANELQSSVIKTGNWTMKMSLTDESKLPFEFVFSESGEKLSMQIINADEKIEVTDIEQRDDSLFIQLPVFESVFNLKIVNDTTLIGNWINYYKSENYKIPVAAKYGKVSRFLVEQGVNNESFEGKYEVVFSPESDSPSKAIGLFKQEGNIVTGTFATETGDYRHLAGNAIGNQLFLSTFDGSHAFLFEAEKTKNGLVGTFYSGTHWKESWVANLNDSVQLRNPNELTFIKDGYDGFSFNFPNAIGDSIALSDSMFDNKVIIVQIMGSWCPNCLDETKYLSLVYDKYANAGVEVVALAFERTRTKEKAFENLARLQNKTGAKYTFLLGGATRKDNATEKLPMLNHIMSYPTAIFLDKNKKVRRIHTGFYGPSTGKYYNDFVAETEELIEALINE